MRAPSATHLPLALPLAVAAAIASTQDAAAQSRFLFSVDWQSPTLSQVDVNGNVITEGDILRPETSNSLPALLVPAGPSVVFDHVTALGLPPGCSGHPGGTPCIVEVDAFSMGADAPFLPGTVIPAGQVIFSVDEYAMGTGTSPFPSLDTEGPVSDASADTFLGLGSSGPAPLPPGPGRHVGFSDGDTAPSASGALYPGVVLREPNLPIPGPVDTGDNMDALDVFESTAGGFPGLYYSLDSGFGDVVEGVPNSGSAAANGFMGGDVLTVSGTGAPALYASAFALGLNVSGADDDDVDAIILRENGLPGYQQSNVPYDWVGFGGSDMLVFSVRRGSAIIGMPDSIFGLPIEEGDLLVPPVLGGGSPFPGIFIAAESLGLATVRSGFGNIGADLNAADSLFGPILDCDGDGIEDAVAIATGLAADADGNGVPDSCGTAVISGPVGTPFCFCPATAAPCGNASSTTGCLNSVGTGALLTGFGPQIAGQSITSPDNLVLTTSGMPGPTFMLMFYGPVTVPPAALGNGLRCIGAPLFRLPPILAVPASGTQSYGPGVVANSAAFNGPPGTIVPGTTWAFQTWYRELGPGPCGMGSNTSNALLVSFI